MRKLKINMQALETNQKKVSLPYWVDVIYFIKLTYQEAMTFNEPEVCKKSPIKYYGKDRVLKEGEFYEGYVLVAEQKFGDWSMGVARIRGAFRKIPAEEIRNNPQEYDRFEIRDGRAWRIECPPEHGEKRDWYYVSILPFCYCDLSSVVKDLQPKTRRLRREDPEAMEQALLNKLWKALVSKDKIVTLTQAEELVLQAALKEVEKDYERVFEPVK